MSYLTTVTLKVEVLVESHHSDCLLAASGWNNGFITAHTQRGETPGIKRWPSVKLSRIYTRSTISNVSLLSLSTRDSED